MHFALEKYWLVLVWHGSSLSYFLEFFCFHLLWSIYYVFNWYPQYSSRSSRPFLLIVVSGTVIVIHIFYFSSSCHLKWKCFFLFLFWFIQNQWEYKLSLLINSCAFHSRFFEPPTEQHYVLLAAMMEVNNFILMHFINTMKIALADLEVFLFLAVLWNKT